MRRLLALLLMFPLLVLADPSAKVFNQDMEVYGTCDVLGDLSVGDATDDDQCISYNIASTDPQVCWDESEDEIAISQDVKITGGVETTAEATVGTTLTANGAGPHTLAGNVSIGTGTAADQTLTFNDDDTDATLRHEEDTDSLNVSSDFVVEGDLLTVGDGTDNNQTLTFHDDDTDGTITLEGTTDRFVVTEDWEFTDTILHENQTIDGTYDDVITGTAVGAGNEYEIWNLDQMQDTDDSVARITMRDQFILAAQGPEGCTAAATPWPCCTGAGTWNSTPECSRSTYAQTFFIGELGKVPVDMIGSGDITAAGDAIYSGYLYGADGIKTGGAGTLPTCGATYHLRIMVDTDGPCWCGCINGTGWVLIAPSTCGITCG